MLRMIGRTVSAVVVSCVLFGVSGCGDAKPVASEEEGMQGMQDMDSGASTAPAG
ncbi:hypothetical protein EC9_51390 [Rosistilla ulvae]|uniref:Uncharacterized protein n=1 Tax=Rosistilla ulvae TaxID=1930277 RepID=A0A517M7R4_9BACT|nr:hypothetical protein EC9_51390 [Rosistilla ulvae]